MADTRGTLPVTYESLGEFAPDWIVTPGDIIEDLLQERGWTKAELALRAGFTQKHINQLLKGAASITQETAIKLEKVLGSTVRFWLGLEAQYREQVAVKADEAALASYGLLNAQIDLDLDVLNGLNIAVFGTNILDKRYYSGGIVVPIVPPTEIVSNRFSGEPATYGIRITKSF